LEKERKESKIHRLTHGQELYTPKKPERKKPTLMTVEQYLKKAGHDKAVSDLVRSLFKKEILAFNEWGNKVTALLKKRV
jgi:hypothetical protein